MTLPDVAAIWQMNGVSVVPILANKTKRPAVRWAEFQVQAPSLGQVEQWWANGREFGLALICGAVSGNLEMLELEGRACDGASITEIRNRVDELGVGDVWDMLVGPNGYSELSPSGGLHLLYRISDHPVPGNTKIAQNGDLEVLAETRGEGGYVIVAPTPGICHPSGEPWSLINGQYGQLPVISWEDRCRVHEALQLALHVEQGTVEVPAPLPVAAASTSSPMTPSGAGLSPGDHFEATTDWPEILEPHGWRLVSRHGPERLWARPGKNPRDGHSATTGHASDRDRLYVFSTSTAFQAEQSYTKFAAYTILNFNGDYHAAAVDLRRKGYGEASQELDVLRREAADDPDYAANDAGNSQYLYDRVRDRFHYLAEEKTYIQWNGQKWVTDQKYVLEHEFITMAQERAERCRGLDDEVGLKWWLKMANRSRIEAALALIRSVPGFTVTTNELNHDKRVINVQNGILDLTTHKLTPHEPGRKMTRIMDAAYEPTAQCPEFEGFMERVLPDSHMRSYVQRALGYSMLGDADQRSLFLICGPSGTGKSTLMSTMEMIFGDYGGTAPSGTLRATGRETNSPSNDLHTLRGLRFVSTSETNEHTAYNEDLIKRLTGRDVITSRRLYQEYQEWSPQCAIWLATNHPPKFNSDDDAIWRRAKIVPFNTVLLGEGEIGDFAHNVLAHERDGILNWLLAGLREYQQNGLGEPESVQEAAREVRLQSDPVARFLEDRISDGVLIEDAGQTIRTQELYSMYTEWARQSGERALGSRRFSNRLTSNYRTLEHTRIQGNHYWRGLGRASHVSILGTMQHFITN